MPTNHEQAHPDFQAFLLHAYKPPNINAVRMKSPPSTASEEVTTVRVVALLTPSEVGIAS